MPELSRADIGQPAAGKTEGDGGAAKPDLASAAAAGGQNLPPQPPVEKVEGQDGGAPPAPKTPSDEYVYPSDESVPEQLRGKKASEAAAAFNTLFQTSRNMAQYLQSQNQAGRQQPPADPPKPTFEKDEFITAEPDAIEKKLGAFFEAKAQPFVADIYRNLTYATMHSAKATLPHYAKYEQEILAELAQTPINLTANFQTWKDAHDRVTARHIDEIAAARGRDKPPTPFTERGGGQAPQGGQATELTADQIKIADGLGVPHDVFKRFSNLYESSNQGV